MRNGTTLLGSFVPRDGRIGAGGWVTGIVFANDGKKMIRTDTYDGYLAPQGRNVQWTSNLRAGLTVAESDLDIFYSADGGEPSPWTSPGTFDVAIAPSNSNVAYQVCLGRVYVTQDFGANWTRCTLASQVGLQANSGNRMTGKALAVDPQNPAVCWFGAPDGVHYTADYGVTWTTVSTASVPLTASGKRYIITFDPSSSVSGGKKQGLYIFVNGSGLYRSTNAGSTWAKITDRPTNPTSAAHLKIAANGNVYLTGNNVNEDAAQFSRWNGTTWFEPTGVVAKSLAISPFNAGYIYICGGGGGLGLSKDYGDTFELGGFCMANARLSPQIPWMQFTVENYMSNGDMEFDPTENTIYVASGIGVWYCNSPPTTIAFAPAVVTWTSCSVGIENMVCFPNSFAPNGTLIQSIGDRAGMTFPKATLGVQFPTCHPTTGGAIQNSCGGDYAPEDNDFIVYATSFCGSAAFTQDAGGSYTMRSTLESTAGATGIGGNIAVFTKDKWVLVETNNGRVWRTSDRGLTWTRCIIGTDTQQFWHGYIYHSRRVLVKDKSVLGRAYIYNAGDNTINTFLADRGVWRTDDYGATWTQIYAGFIIAYGADHFHGKLSQYDATSLLWCGGDNALGLWKLSGVNGTATKSEVTGTDDVVGAARFAEVYGVGVAKGASSSTSPAVLVCGFRMVTPANASSINDPSGFGYWLSLDGMVTWTRIAKFIGGNFDLCQDVAGDPSTFARFAIGHGGSGNQIVDYSNVQRWN